MGAYDPEYESHLLALGEKMFLTQVPFPRKKPRRRQDLELAALARPTASDSSHCRRLLQWLRALPSQSKLEVCCEESAWLSSLLRQMFALKSSGGEGFFTLHGNGPHMGEPEELEEFFTFRKVSMEHGLALRLADVMQTQRHLERNLRFCDSRGYLDTVTLQAELILDTDKFLQEMNKAAGGKAFTSPCRVKWDSVCKVWVWEVPVWCQGANLGLAIWALACIERHVWMKYWEAQQLDPRGAMETQPFAWGEGRVSGLVSMYATLREYWLSLGAARQTSVLSGLEAVFLAEKPHWEKRPRPRKFPYPPPSFTSFSHSKHCSNFGGSLMGLFSSPAGTYYSALRARMQCCQSSKSVEELTQCFNQLSKAAFFDVVFFSDLVRAGSILDQVARAVVMRVKRALEEKYAEDLILSEVSKPCKSPKKPSKHAKKKTKSPKSAANSAVPASPATLPVREDSAPWVRGLVLALLDTVPGLEETVDDSSFQLVENTRRKAKNSQPGKAQDKAKKKNKPGKQSHKYSKSEIKASAKAAISPNHAPLAIKVVHNAVQQLTLAPEMVAAEFPPLAKAVTCQPFPRLSEELQAFELANSLVVEQQTYTRMRLMERLREIVAVLFPGADAQLFGSYSTSLALPTSDLDVAVRNTSFHFREEVQAAVKSLNNFLLFQPWTLSTKAISTATVPLVKLEVDPGYFSGSEARPIKVDLTFEAQRSHNEHIGLASAEFVHRWVKQYPQAKSVALVLKQLMQGNDLNSAYLGGVSSYALILWLMAYLRKEGLADCGALLLGFLKFYAEDFNPKTTGIDLLKPE